MNKICVEQHVRLLYTFYLIERTSPIDWLLPFRKQLFHPLDDRPNRHHILLCSLSPRNICKTNSQSIVTFGTHEKVVHQELTSDTYLHVKSVKNRVSHLLHFEKTYFLQSVHKTNYTSN